MGADGEYKLERFPDGAYVLIADDFTNSGGTLFGGATIVRSHASADVTVGAFVTHYVAQYDRANVAKFVRKLQGESGSPPVLNQFSCTNSIPMVVSWLQEEAKSIANGKELPITVMSVAPVIAEWVLKHAPCGHVA